LPSRKVLAWQIEQAMKENISRNNLARRMKTPRSQIGRLLDPNDGNVTLTTLQRAARMVGGRCGWNWFERALNIGGWSAPLRVRRPGKSS
jgi:hypothetical protein